MPEEGLAKISEYFHVNTASRLYESAVQAWIFDDLISGEIEWMPVLRGTYGDWRQHPLITSISGFAACESVTAAPDTRRGLGGQQIGRGE